MKNISRKEKSTKADAKYYYITMEKPVIEHSGETVEQFLARGGTINRVQKAERTTPQRGDNGKFVKKSQSTVSTPEE